MESPELTYDYEYFKKEVKRLLDVDLDQYKEGQMKRRINTLIGRRKCIGYQDYVETIEHNAEELNIFKKYITINVTEFFRDSSYWEYLVHEVYPALTRRKKKLKIWSVASSTGEEPYSLAMSMMEYAPEADFEILATDIDDETLEIAKAGKYSEVIIKTMPETYKEKYFHRSDEQYEIDESVKQHVQFEKLDLLQDEFPKECDLIVCRNVLIYFTNEAKAKIFEKFEKSLTEEGYIFFGRTEQIVNWKRTPFIRLASSFYKLRNEKERNTRTRDYGSYSYY